MFFSASLNTKSERLAFKSARAASTSSFCANAASLRDLAASWGLYPMPPFGFKLLGAVGGFKHLGSFVQEAAHSAQEGSLGKVTFSSFFGGVANSLTIGQNDKSKKITLPKIQFKL